MMRILPYRSALPQWLAFASAVALWIALCAAALAHAIDEPGKFTITAAAAVIALPVALLRISSIPIYLLCAYAVLVPFSSILVTPTGETMTKLLGVAVGAALLFSTVMRRRVVAPSKAMFVMAAFTAYAGLTILWSIDQSLALNSYAMYINYIALYVAIALYPATPAEARLVLIATLAGALVCAAYGGYLFSHGQQIYESRLGIGNGDTNWIDPNEYAATMLAPIAISLMLMLRTRAPALKLSWLLVLAVLTYGFVVSGSRGGMVALGVMVVFLIVRSRHRLQLLPLIPALAIAIASSPIGLRLMQQDVGSADLRTDIWKVGLASLQQYWLAGAGVGNFNNAFAQYFLSTPHAALSWDRVAHSVVIQGAVEYGIPGLILLLALWYTQFTELRKVSSGARPEIALALQATVLGLFIAGLSLSLMFLKCTWLAFSLVALVRSASMTSQSDRARDT